MSNPPIPGISALPRELVQIAYTVPDLEAACQEWAEKVGAGPFLVRRHMEVQASHDGQPAVYDHSAAFGQWGPVMLEIIQLHECEPASMREVLEHEGPGQVNHFACFVDDLEDLGARAVEAAGFAVAGASVGHDVREEGPRRDHRPARALDAVQGHVKLCSVAHRVGSSSSRSAAIGRSVSLVPRERQSSRATRAHSRQRDVSTGSCSGLACTATSSPAHSSTPHSQTMGPSWGTRSSREITSAAPVVVVVRFVGQLGDATSHGLAVVAGQVG